METEEYMENLDLEEQEEQIRNEPFGEGTRD